MKEIQYFALLEQLVPFVKHCYIMCAIAVAILFYWSTNTSSGKIISTCSWLIYVAQRLTPFLAINITVAGQHLQYCWEYML